MHTSHVELVPGGTRMSGLVRQDKATGVVADDRCSLSHIFLTVLIHSCHVISRRSEVGRIFGTYRFSHSLQQEQEGKDVDIRTSKSKSNKGSGRTHYRKEHFWT